MKVTCGRLLVTLEKFDEMISTLEKQQSEMLLQTREAIHGSLELKAIDSGVWKKKLTLVYGSWLLKINRVQ